MGVWSTRYSKIAYPPLNGPRDSMSVSFIPCEFEFVFHLASSRRRLSDNVSNLRFLLKEDLPKNIIDIVIILSLYSRILLILYNTFKISIDSYPNIFPFKKICLIDFWKTILRNFLNIIFFVKRYPRKCGSENRLIRLY